MSPKAGWQADNATKSVPRISNLATSEADNTPSNIFVLKSLSVRALEAPENMSPLFDNEKSEVEGLRSVPLSMLPAK